MKEKDKKKLIEEQSERLKCVIQEVGLKNNEFAEKIGISVQTLNYVLNRTRCMSANLATKIENVFGTSSVWLLNGEGAKYSTFTESELRSKILIEKIDILQKLNLDNFNAIKEQLERLKEEIVK